MAGDVYTFTTDATGHVNACKKNNVTVALPTCLDGRARYSAFLKFTTDRVIAK